MLNVSVSSSVLLLWQKKTVIYLSDINECAQKPSPCKLGERCDNTPGSYKCVQTFSCANGLQMKDLQCLDIDECTLGNHTCLPPATCKNTYGSFYVNEKFRWK